MKKEIYIIPVLLFGFLFSGCAETQAKPKVVKVCNIGVMSYDKKHCLLTDKPLLAVVQSVKFNNKLYNVVLSDERGRKFHIEIDKKVFIGDIININLYKNPKVKSIPYK